MTTERIDIFNNLKGWAAYYDITVNALLSIPFLMERFASDVGNAFQSVIRERIDIYNLTWTGTYEESLFMRVEDSEDGPDVVIGFEPIGSESHRLPIYWKVTETGAGPNSRLPRKKIIEWATAKLGVDARSAATIAQTIATEGIKRKRILRTLFVFTPDMGVSGLTDEAVELMKVAWWNVAQGFVEILEFGVRGKVRRQAMIRTPRGPRFGPVIRDSHPSHIIRRV